jgi:DNA invertase Pin-like site-specific DNA recombinase
VIQCVLYLRVSTAKQDTSVADQRSELTKYARRHGFRIVREYLDEAISGDDTRKRFGFQKMVADSQRGEFEAILCWDQDRFGRFDPLEAGYWIQPLRTSGVYLQTIAQGRIDWNDFAGRMIYSVQQEAKHSFLRDLSRNVMRGMRSSIQQHQRPLGPRPLGYVRVGDAFAIEPEAAEIVRRIYRDYLAGQSLLDLVRTLNAEGVRTARGGYWTPAAIRWILHNEAYCGVATWGRTTRSKYNRMVGDELKPAENRTGSTEAGASPLRIEDAYPVLIDRETWERVQQSMTERKTHTFPQRRRRGFPLSGLLVCGWCGSRMYGRLRPDGRAYFCGKNHRDPSQCVANVAHETQVLARVLDDLRDQLRQPAHASGFVDALRELHGQQEAAPDTKALRRSLAATEGKLATAERRLVECDAEFLPVVQARIRELRAERDALRRSLTLAETPDDALVAGWQEFVQRATTAIDMLSASHLTIPPEEFRQALAEIVDHVVVTARRVETGPSNHRFVLESVETRLKLDGSLD